VRSLEFAKYQGTGNDFVMFADLDDAHHLDPREVAALCDRRRGVGADGVIRIVGTDDGDARFFMDYRNADGSTAEMCGNGIRCVGAFLHDRGMVHDTELDVATRAGVKHVCVESGPHGRIVTVGMGSANFTKAAIPMRGPAWETFLAQPFDLGGGVEVAASAVSMGNPHLVLFIQDDPDRVHVAHIGPELERHEWFPEGTNVEFAQVRDGEIKARVWERGSGETMACGSGACAVAVAAHETGRAGPSMDVRFPGGLVHVERTDHGVTLRGDAQHVFDGSIELDRA
jgi:diaminopimelate epimerase